MSANPYETLGVTRGASDDEIKRAYRALAKKYHPDRNKGDAQAEERFKAIGSAYGILGDAERRKRFDRGEIDAQGQDRAPFGAGFGGRGGFGTGFGGQGPGHGPGPGEDDLGAFFSDMFSGGFQGDFQPGGTAGRRAPRRGADRSFRLSIPFVDAVLGTTTRVSLPDGEAFDVRVPPGIENGQTLRVRGKGGPARRGPRGEAGGGDAGDALIEVTVDPDARFTRDGTSVHTKAAMDLRMAVLGGKLTVPTPKGNVTVTVPRHSDTGRVLRLAGRGVGAHGGAPAGDLLVTLEIRLGKPDPALEAFLADHPG